MHAIVRLLYLDSIRYGQAFTGADSGFFEPSKEVMKMMAYYYGVNTAPFVFAYDDDDIEEACQTLRFPLIVKHYNGYSSVGMTKDSRCTTADQLRVQVAIPLALAQTTESTLRCPYLPMLAVFWSMTDCLPPFQLHRPKK